MQKEAGNQKVTVRIPPSPTGHFHVGRARTALFNYLFAKKNQGEIVFRLEDTDKERSREEFAVDILESLEWLGITFDSGPFKQSERTEIYKKYLKKMIDDGFAYVSKGETGQNKEVIRFKNPNKKIVFDDLVRGQIEFDTSDLKDFVIAKNLDEPLYHLTVVVDDFEMGITHILRGEDGISNTPRQILIQEAIGAPRPIYAHIPLILAPDRSKMSARHGAVSLKDFRDMGYLPEAFLNFLALLGWNPGGEREIYSLKELEEIFDIKKVNKSGAIFNILKLDWFNREYLKVKSDDEFLAEIKKRLPAEYAQSEFIKKIIPVFRDRIFKWGDINKMHGEGELSYYFEMPKATKEGLVCPEKLRKGLQVSFNDVKAHLQILEEKLGEISNDWNAENIKNAIWDYASEQGRGVVLWALRYALSGKDKSPDPFTLSDILGKGETLLRIKHAYLQ